MSDPGLQLDGLTKRFGDHAAVREVTLHVPAGKVLALLGPSGSGKTTTLRLIAGFERPDAGTIRVGGEDVTSLSPAARRFGMVFQHYALFPHLDVGENVAFGLDRNLSKAERARRVESALAQVDLRGFERRRVDALSGGQQQRVAVARAVAPHPRVLLFDEPLSNLDPALRERTRRELRAAIDEIGVTTVFVTHEQEEAFALGDVVTVLRDGWAEQVGTPRELYESPATRFVATFVGRASTVPGVMVGADRARVSTGVEWPVSAAEHLEGEVDIVVRPEHLTLTDGSGLRGVVRERRYTGARAFFDVTTDVGTLEIEGAFDAAAPGDQVWVTATRGRAFDRAAS